MMLYLASVWHFPVFERRISSYNIVAWVSSFIIGTFFFLHFTLLQTHIHLRRLVKVLRFKICHVDCYRLSLGMLLPIRRRDISVLGYSLLLHPLSMHWRWLDAIFIRQEVIVICRCVLGHSIWMKSLRKYH